jgi:Ca2+-binding EF-hand superfamily protein
MKKEDSRRCLLSSFILKICSIERYNEAHRQILCDKPDFEPYLAFIRLSNESANAVTPNHIQNFLSDNGIEVKSRKCQNLINHYDLDRDGMLSYLEFINMVLPKEHPELRAYVAQKESYHPEESLSLSVETERQLAYLIEQELTIFEQSNSLKKRLDDLGVTSMKMLDMIDKEVNGNINFNNLQSFLNSVGLLPYDAEIINFLRRLDKDDDGVISPKELDNFLNIYNMEDPISGPLVVRKVVETKEVLHDRSGLNSPSRRGVETRTKTVVENTKGYRHEFEERVPSNKTLPPANHGVKAVTKQVTTKYQRAEPMTKSVVIEQVIEAPPKNERTYERIEREYRNTKGTPTNTRTNDEDKYRRQLFTQPQQPIASSQIITKETSVVRNRPDYRLEESISEKTPQEGYRVHTPEVKTRVQTSNILEEKTTSVNSRARRAPAQGSEQSPNFRLNKETSFKKTEYLPSRVEEVRKTEVYNLERPSSHSLTGSRLRQSQSSNVPQQRLSGKNSQDEKSSDIIYRAFKMMLNQERNLELARRELVTKVDFDIKEVFGMIDKKKRNWFSIEDFRLFLNEIGLQNIDTRPLIDLYSSYDVSQSCLLNFEQLINMLCPMDNRFATYLNKPDRKVRRNFYFRKFRNRPWSSWLTSSTDCFR